MSSRPLEWIVPELAGRADRLARLIHELPLPVVGLDREDLVLIWNHAAERLFGWPAAEVVGRPLPTVPAGLNQEFQGLKTLADREGHAAAEVARRTRSGEILWVRLHKAPLRSEGGEVMGTLAAMVDITTERRARAAEAALFDWLPIPMWEEDLTGVTGPLQAGRFGGLDSLGDRLAGDPETAREVLSMLRMTRANPAALRMFGVGSLEELRHRLPNLYLPETRRVLGQVLQAAMEGRLPFDSGMMPYRRGRGTGWLCVHVAAPPDAGRPPSRVLVAFTDLTPLQRAREAVHARDRALHTLTEATARLTGRAFLEGLVTAFTEVLGVDHAQIGVVERGFLRTLVRCSDGRLVSVPDESLANTPCAEALEQGRAVFDGDLAARFPRNEWIRSCELVSYAGVALQDSEGRSTGVVSVFSTTRFPDTSLVTAVLEVMADRVSAELARMRAEEELQRREALYEDLVEQSGLAIFVDDAEGDLVYVNRRFCELFGYRPEEILGRPSALVVHPEERERLAARHAARMRGEPQPTSYRIRGVTSDGRELVLETAVTPVVHRGLLAGTRCYVSDVTERVSLERQLAQAQKMEALGQLSAGVAHDFNNMLQAILVRAEAARRSPDLPDRTRKHLEGIYRATEKAIDLARGLLAFSRKSEVQREAVDVGRTVSGILKILERVIGENIAVRVKIGGEVPPVLADRGELEQVVMNLAVNARDAMPEGGTLTLSVRGAELDADFCEGRPWARPGQWVILGVTDTGHGMDDATRERIFEPFFTTKGRDKGTGLGLATVYRIVTELGGMIEVDSVPGRGTTFTVYLPAAAREAGPRAAEAEDRTRPRAARAGGRTVLLAEDEPEVAGVMTEVLRSAGYRVLHAGEGGEALELFRRHGEEIAAAVLDVRMPGMTGPEVGASLRRERPALPIVYMSGMADVAGESSGDALRGPGVAFLRKPFTGATLLRTLARVLGEEAGQQPD